MKIQINQIKRSEQTLYTEILFQLTPEEVGKLLVDHALRIPIHDEAGKRIAEYGVKVVKGRAEYE